MTKEEHIQVVVTPVSTSGKEILLLKFSTFMQKVSSEPLCGKLESFTLEEEMEKCALQTLTAWNAKELLTSAGCQELLM